MPKADELLAFVSAVFAGALAGYRELVERWFPRFAPSLSTYQIFPVQITGKLRIVSSEPSPEDAKVLDWYMDPLPNKMMNRVNISWSDSPEDWTVDGWETRWHQVTVLRPGAERWIRLSHSSQSLDSIFGEHRPITALAYKWLAADLKRLKWAI